MLLFLRTISLLRGTCVKGLLVAGLLVSGITTADRTAWAEEREDAASSGIREIVVPNLAKSGKMTRIHKPVVIRTREELEEVITDKEVVEAILAKVSINKEWLAYFRWSGSGQDQITAAIVKEEDGQQRVEFTYLPGRTKDLRQHVKLFAVHKQAAAPPEAASGELSDDMVKVRDALATWAKMKGESGGNYSYTIRFSSFAGFGHVTTIMVRDNKVTERRYESFQREPKPITLGQEPPQNEGWTETGKELGSHKEGAPALTLDEIYANAEKIAAVELADHEKRYIRRDKQGLLTSCFTIDTRIADDSPTQGIVISSITISAP